jgi:hypothetical protein
MTMNLGTLLENSGQEAPLHSPCALTVDRLGVTPTLEDAWRWLPTSGQGIVVLADRVTRFEPGRHEGLLVEADVADGGTTTVIRLVGAEWHAWRWSEGAGDSHLAVDAMYMSSEPAPAGAAPHLRYRTYWTQVADDGIAVWQPCGARFAGFAQA